MRKKLVIGFLAAVILCLISFIADVRILGFVSLIRNNSLDYFFNSIGYASNVFIVFFFLTSLFLWQEHKRRWILPLWLTSLFAVIVSYLIKILVQRARPFQSGAILVFNLGYHFIKDNFQTWNFSFPSFQALLVFSALPILDREFPRFKYVWLVFASLVAFSRVYFGLHYMSDVIAGGVIGYALGLGVVKIEEKYGVGKRVMKRLGMKK